ncbi:MAG: energy-coupled thiamine transporter ThiT [Clostridia bacterium]|nr:energy-coupled thiamine transporter ThiT [Clostridia bacterium]
MANQTEKTKRLALTGVMLALAVILSFLKVFEAPFGGSVTACSMLPIMVIGYTYGVKWGMLTGVVDGVLQAIFGATMTGAYASQNVVGILLITCIDYLLAFSVIGLAGLFKNKVKNPTASFSFGIAAASLLRLLCHFTSGCILYGQWASWFFEEQFVNSFSQKLLATGSEKLIIVMYSLIYNAAYMIPETVVTVVAGALLISLVPPVRREMTRSNA